MMHFRHSTTASPVRHGVHILLPFVIALILYSAPLGYVHDAVRVAVYRCAVPVWAVRDHVYAVYDGMETVLSDMETLQRERDQLAAEVASLRRAQSTTLARLADARHGFGSDVAPEGVVRAALRYPFDERADDLFFIDAGASEGVLPGNLVYTDEAAAVGYVSYAFDAHAVVAPFVRSGVETGAVLLGVSTTTHVAVEGRSASTLSFSVPRDVPVSLDSALVLPYRETYVLGYVRAVELDPEDAFKHVFVRPAVQPFELRSVLVDTSFTYPDDTLLYLDAARATGTLDVVPPSDM